MTIYQAIPTTDTNGKDIGPQDFTLISCGEDLYCLEYLGSEYYFTGKTGTNNKTGKPVSEMANREDERLWIADNNSLVVLD